MVAARPGYVPAVTLMRTELERTDQRASWMRTDEAFFAAGACHVLAFALLRRCPDAGYKAILIRPRHDLPGTHVYVRCGPWAFDFNGWTQEEVLLFETTAACRRTWPTWDHDLIVTCDSIEDFCRSHRHRLPSEYHGDAMARAVSYLERFDERPPFA